MIAQVFTDIRICVTFLHLFGVIGSIILLITELNVRRCWFYIMWRKVSWENYFL